MAEDSSYELAPAIKIVLDNETRLRYSRWGWWLIVTGLVSARHAFTPVSVKKVTTATAAIAFSVWLSGRLLTVAGQSPPG